MSDKGGGIFVLDDDVLFLKIYKELFAAKGYKVFVTDNVKQFLQEARQKLPDVMLVDINLPHTSGWEVLRQIAQDTVLQQIPTVLLSVCQDYELAHIKGAAHFIINRFLLRTWMIFYAAIISVVCITIYCCWKSMSRYFTH